MLKENNKKLSCANFEIGQCLFGDKCVFNNVLPLPNTCLTSEEKKT
jgi:hypothetical protein